MCFGGAARRPPRAFTASGRDIWYVLVCLQQVGMAAGTAMLAAGQMNPKGFK